MKVNIDYVMVDISGDVLKEQVPSGEKNLLGQPVLVDGGPLTLRRVIMTSLTASFQDEASLSGEKKLERWQLAIRVKSGPTIMDFSSEQIVLIKTLVAKAYGPVVSGQAWELLEGRDENENPVSKGSQRVRGINCDERACK